jgi:hypothetical protein
MATALTVRTLRDFSYLKGIDADTAMFLDEKTDQISEQLRDAGRAIARAGKYLTEVRDHHLPYGWFEAWLQAEFRFSVRHAERFMSVYDRFPELAGDNLSELDNVSLSALYLLAAPSTPYGAVQEVRALATVAPVSWSETERIVNAHKGRDDGDPDETRGRKPDKAREEIENTIPCLLDQQRLAALLSELPHLIYADGVNTQAQKRRLSQIVQLAAQVDNTAKEAHGYLLAATRALGYATQ